MVIEVQIPRLATLARDDSTGGAGCLLCGFPPRLFAPCCGDFSIDLSQGELVSSFSSGCRPDFLKHFRGRRKVFYVIANAHDDDLWVAASVHDKALIFLTGPPKDLAELRSGGQS